MKKRTMFDTASAVDDDDDNHDEDYGTMTMVLTFLLACITHSQSFNKGFRKTSFVSSISFYQKTFNTYTSFRYNKTKLECVGFGITNLLIVLGGHDNMIPIYAQCHKYVCHVILYTTHGYCEFYQHQYYHEFSRSGHTISQRHISNASL